MQDPATALTLPDPLPLDSGAVLSPVTIAYQEYGKRAADGSNVVVIFHALTGDQYAASPHPGTGRPGWWDRMVGPGKPIDTDRLCVICANVIGGCLGSTGPASERPDGTRYAQSFPVVTIHDMVRAFARMLDELGIDRVHAVVGGSMGGMQALAFASDFPDRAERVLVLASAARQSAQNIAFHEVGRQAIMADANWNGGDYYGGAHPDAGLAVARMAAHITYLSEKGLTEKFGRRLQAKGDGKPGEKSFGFDADFQVESYLRYQGSGFTRRFDANSYLYITRAMDYFDLAEEHGGPLADAFAGASARFCIVSFDTDWLYPTAESQHLVRALNAAGAPVSFVELSSPFGHDGFLLETPGLDEVVRGFLT